MGDGPFDRRDALYGSCAKKPDQQWEAVPVARDHVYNRGYDIRVIGHCEDVDGQLRFEDQFLAEEAEMTQLKLFDYAARQRPSGFSLPTCMVLVNSFEELRLQRNEPQAEFARLHRYPIQLD